MCFCNPNYQSMYEKYKHIHPEDGVAASIEGVEEWFLMEYYSEDFDLAVLRGLMRMKSKLANIQAICRS